MTGGESPRDPARAGAASSRCWPSSRRGRPRARHSGRRARAGLRQAGGPAPPRAAARAARRDERGRHAAARPGLPRPAARRRGAARRRRAVVRRQPEPVRGRSAAAARRRWRWRGCRWPPTARSRHGTRRWRICAARRSRVDTDLYWKQQHFDLLLEVPIASERSRFSIDPRLARMGLQGRHDAALPAARRGRARLRVPRQPGAGAPRPALAPGRAALRRRRLLPHPRRHRPPAVHRLPRDPVPAPAAARRHRHGVHGRAFADADRRRCSASRRKGCGSRRWSSC